MEYQVFARKFRPQQFNSVIGQDHIIRTLKNALIQNRIAQSFLFVGTRGVGKTSTARILAKALNCQGEREQPYESCGECSSCTEITAGTSLDILEIDGASNRGIDEIRNLRDNVKFKPMNGKYKVYIIDEVHMLTSEAFNALLKTLEEPPEHVKFIFATTEAHKIPQTILSRTQRYDFRHIPFNSIVETLKKIASAEKIKVDEKALFLVAKNAEGSLRDAESLFDKLSSSLSKNIEYEKALQILGITNQEIYYGLTKAIIDRKADLVLDIVATEESTGKDLVHFTKGWLGLLRDLMVIKAAKKPDNFIIQSDEDKKAITEIAGQLSLKEILYFFKVAQNAYQSMRYSSFPRMDLESALFKLLSRESLYDLSLIVKWIEELQKNPNATSQTSISSYQPAQKKKSSPPAQAAEPDLEEPPLEDPNEIKTQAQSINKASGNLKGIGSIWGQLLAAIKEDKMSTSTYLESSQLFSFENKKLTLAFSPQNQFFKESLDTPDNRALVEKHLKSFLDQDVRVEFITHSGKEAPQGEKKKDMNDEDLSLIESALNIFNGRVVEDSSSSNS